MNVVVMLLRKLALFALAMSVLTFSSCMQHHPKGSEKLKGVQDEQFERLVAEARASNDEHLLPVIDSLEAAGELSSARADFLRGISYEQAEHTLVAEQYYAKLYENQDPEGEGWDLYLEVATRLASTRMIMSDQKGALEVATEAYDRAEKAGELTDRQRVGLLWSIAACQGQLCMEEAEQTSLRVYEMLENQVGGADLEGLLAWTYVMFQIELIQQDYAAAEEYLDKAADLLEQLPQPKDSLMLRQYTGEVAMGRVRLLDSLGQEEEAYAFYRQSLPLLLTPESMSEAADYLLGNEKFSEAADMYDKIDKILPSDNRESVMNLDNIAGNIIPRLQANLGAGRKDAVVALARRIAEHFIPAVEEERENDAAELAIIFDTKGKELRIAEQEAKLSKQRLWGAVIGFGLILLFLILFTIHRQRAARRLADMKAAKERIESELRVARDIQMSMVPSRFPERDGLDLYAEMTPAKEVGGDLYDFFVQGDKLYFCVGDVSGKGVPASLFMSQAVRLFRTFAGEGVMPADIACRMNAALSENNEQCMFVTMFMGLLSLDTGHLDYCNCGHNPPILDAQFLAMQHINPPLGLWENEVYVGETIDDIRGRQLLVYTDGLNEAENGKQEILGNDRLLELTAGMQSLSARQVIEGLCEAVAQHRAGADPNDDLTLMCLKLIK